MTELNMSWNGSQVTCACGVQVGHRIISLFIIFPLFSEVLEELLNILFFTQFPLQACSGGVPQGSTLGPLLFRICVKGYHLCVYALVYTDGRVDKYVSIMLLKG